MSERLVDMYPGYGTVISRCFITCTASTYCLSGLLRLEDSFIIISEQTPRIRSLQKVQLVYSLRWLPDWNAISDVFHAVTNRGERQDNYFLIELKVWKNYKSRETHQQYWSNGIVSDLASCSLKLEYITIWISLCFVSWADNYDIHYLTTYLSWCNLTLFGRQHE